MLKRFALFKPASVVPAAAARVAQCSSKIVCCLGSKNSWHSLARLRRQTESAKMRGRHGVAMRR